MTKKLFYVLIASALFMISGCSNEGDTTTVTTENPDAEEILNSEPEADIFQFNDVIYKTGIDWVEEKDLTKNKQIGVIKEKNENDTNFSNGTANKLPVGAKIYTTKEESDIFLIVESNGETKKYYGIVEG